MRHVSKKLFLLVITPLLVLGGLVGTLVYPSSVEAAPAVCYDVATGSGSYALQVDCNSNPFWARLLEISGQSGFQDNQCYEVGSMAAVISYPLNSPQCAALALRSQDTSEAGPKCWTLQGSLDQIDELSFDASRMSERPCDENLKSVLLENGAGFTDYKNGWCYVLADGNTTRTYTCSSLLSTQLGADANDARARQNQSDGAVPIEVNRDEIANCGQAAEGATPERKAEIAQECLEINPIVKTVYLAVNVLSAIAAIAIILGIIIGGVQYSTAGANPQAVSAAKGRIINALIALLALTFLYSFLQWLIPGGIF